MTLENRGDFMYMTFNNYDDFAQEYKKYHMDKCSFCRGVCELEETYVSIEINNYILEFPKLFVLKCKKCGKEYLPQHSKQMIDGAYKSMVKNGQQRGQFISKGYRKKFDYCIQQDYQYDHRDYYNIPGLCYDEEHSKEGFLTPVYFDRKALIYFISVPEFEVNIFSETYGSIGRKDSEGVYAYEWKIPFGFNTNGKLVFWLGDIDDMDEQSKTIIKAFNVESDHLIIDSEFFQAQMNCIFSQPIKEMQIIHNKNIFIENIKKKYNIDLRHLEVECKEHTSKIQRPLIYSEQIVSTVINAYDKILVEGFSVENLRLLYENLYVETERDVRYKNWQSIKLIEAVLVKLSNGLDNVPQMNILISPLYILHDYRIFLDHLLSEDKQNETKNHIVKTLNVSNFTEQEKIYNEEIDRLNILFQYLSILSK